MLFFNITDANSEKNWTGLLKFDRREINRVIGPSTLKIKDIKNEVRLSTPHICYRLIF